MKSKRTMVLFTGILLLVFGLIFGQSINNDSPKTRVPAPKQIQSLKNNLKPDMDFGKVPLYFIPNKGQVN
ncbi:MAG: hypothetical protein GY765_03690, partial [bacterium]|nr:hypothetical protein [bacterium]